MERPGELVEKEALFAAVWGQVVVEDCNLARHVANLRRALGDDPERPSYIETIPRRGYRFVAPVTSSPAPAPRAAALGPPEPEAMATPPVRAEPDVAAPPPEPTPTPAPEVPASRPGRGLQARVSRLRDQAGRLREGAGRLGRGAILLAALVALPSATWLTAEGRGRGPIRSIAVLPVANLTGDPRHDHLAEALGEMTVNDLGRLRRSRTELLRVLPRSAASVYRATAKPATLVASELGVDCLLETSLLHADGQVRFAAELVDGRSGAVVWAHEVDGPVSEFMALQDDLVFGLAAHLGLAPQAVDLPLAGRHVGLAPGAPAVQAQPDRRP